MRARPPCPLCAFGSRALVRQLSVPALVERWRGELGIDISGSLPVDAMALLRCRRCGLESFDPMVVGGPELYEQLMKLDWYYMPEKWEFGVAAGLLRRGDVVLDVGAGSGRFLEGLLRSGGATGHGIDTNDAAVADGQRRGLPLERASVEEWAELHPRSADMVCAFQILEHVADPRAFLESCLAALRPGGRLFLSVPDSGGWVGREDGNLLNAPPHHVTRWSEGSLRFLGRELGAARVEVHREPLAAYHSAWFLQVVTRPLSSLGRPLRLARRATLRVGGSALRLAPLRRLLPGHTIAAVLTFEGSGA